MSVLAHLGAAALAATVSLAGFLSLPMYGLWGPAAWLAFLVGVGGAAVMTVALGSAISSAR